MRNFSFHRLWIHEARPGQLHGQGYPGLGEEHQDGYDTGQDAGTQGGHRYNVSSRRREIFLTRIRLRNPSGRLELICQLKMSKY